MAVVQHLSPNCGHKCTKWSLSYFQVIRAKKIFWINDPNEMFIICIVSRCVESTDLVKSGSGFYAQLIGTKIKFYSELSVLPQKYEIDGKVHISDEKSCEQVCGYDLPSSFLIFVQGLHEKVTFHFM